MMKKEKLITFLILALILTTNVYADDEHGGEIILEPAFKYLIIRPMINYGICASHAIWVLGEGTSFARNCDRVILYNPPMDGILPFLNMLLRILLPIFSLLIVSIGFYLLMLPSSPGGRVKAKSMFGRLIITMVIISVSPLLMDITLAVSRGLTESIFSLVSMDTIKTILWGGLEGVMVLAAWLAVPEAILGLIPFMLTFAFAWLPYLMISLRNIILTALMIVFPLGILFYSIPSLRSIGKTILEQFLVWTFLQAFMALALVSVAKAFLVINLDPNPIIYSQHMEILFTQPQFIVLAPIISILFDAIEASGMEIPFYSTDLKTLSFGIVAYAVVIISPLIMVTIFRKFLP